MTRFAPSSSAGPPRRRARPSWRRSGRTSSRIGASRRRAGSSWAPVDAPGPELTLDRLDRRRTLLEQLEQSRRAADAAASRSSGIDRHRAMAYELARLAGHPRRRSTSTRRRTTTRSLYGMTLFGQASLTARRLVEAGGRFVTVFWDEYGLAGTGWDTHWDHFPRMKDELLPGLDQTFSGLLIDLDRRGLLDETLVVLLSEHGRTPEAHARATAAAATTGRAATRSSWPAAGSPAAGSSAGPTRSPATPPNAPSRPRTSWPRSITSWASTRAPCSPTSRAGPCRSSPTPKSSPKSLA